jgi:hypothetical protein
MTSDFYGADKNSAVVSAMNCYFLADLEDRWRE